MGYVLGIDLGTTNSCAAVLQDGIPMIVPIDAGAYTLPSVIGFPASGGRYLVGLTAKRQAVLNASNTIFAAKRLIGRSYTDPETKRAMIPLPYRCVQGPDGDVRVRIRDRTWSIQELSALVLAELKTRAETYLESEITQAVITTPAYFNDTQRQATKDAARIAGLEVLRIINEPTAAALAHGFVDGAERHVAVYDFGGGTFDVSVLRVGGGVVEVLATAGDPFLGGVDFDDRVVEWLNTYVFKNCGVSINEDLNAQQRLREAAESARIALSTLPQTKIILPFLGTAANGSQLHVDCELDAETLEALVNDLIERSVDMFVEAVHSAELDEKEVDEVILVGGLTRTPLIRRRVQEITGRSPTLGVHPDLVVAVGAAIQGALLVGGMAPVVLLDVTPHNLGIMTVAGMVEVIIPKDTTVPTEARRLFATAKDNQEVVEIVVYQGEGADVTSNEILGRFRLEGLRRAARGSVRIEVEFTISADGIVRVTGRDLDTGKEQAIRISGSHGLAPDEMERMIAQHRERTMNALQDLPMVVPEQNTRA